MEFFILDPNGNEVAVDRITWVQWFVDADARRIARTDISSDCHVSTVFLGIDHGHGGQRLLYETMVFGGAFGGSIDRHGTRQEAEEGHRRMVSRVVNYKG